MTLMKLFNNLYLQGLLHYLWKSNRNSDLNSFSFCNCSKNLKAIFPLLTGSCSVLELFKIKQYVGAISNVVTDVIQNPLIYLSH